jgi:archaemetzincin
MISLRIIPFGDIPKEVFDILTEELLYKFTALVDVYEQIGLPKEHFNSVRHQFLSERVLEFISSNFKGRTLGILDEDLYTGDLNFIFGQAQMRGKVAIISVHRMKPTFYKNEADKNILMQRIVKEAVHEVGHMLGLEHCNNSGCVMNFSNTIIDVDRKTKDLCESCKNKLGVY